MSTNNSAGNTIVAIGLIGLGALFMASMILGFSFWNFVWPFFIIVPGLPFVYFAYSGGRDLSWLAIPGHLITGTGVILLYQSSTNHWESWAYAWALYGVFLGTALSYAGQRNNEKDVVEVGKWFTWIGLFLFIGFGVFFELLIFGGWMRRLMLAAILIGVGIWLLARDNEFKIDLELGSTSKPKNKPKRSVYMPPGDDPFEAPARKSRLEIEIDEALGRETPQPQNGGGDNPAEA